MARDVQVPLALAACPVCYEGIRLAGTIYAGRQVLCPDCGACLVVVEEDCTELDGVRTGPPAMPTPRRARERYACYSGVRAVGHLGE